MSQKSLRDMREVISDKGEAPQAPEGDVLSDK